MKKAVKTIGKTLTKKQKNKVIGGDDPVEKKRLDKKI
tara:strand:+ start:14012 stop:14122 length:111 start_codon:yes stop_codon:yes gene_type:complete